MGMSGDTALALAKNYVKKTLQGQGALKGQDGFSPIIEENADNTDKVYKLDITTADSAFTTPNLRGKDGEGSGGGEANVIESISVNGTPISVDENKNVDITVPSIDGLAKTEDIPTKVSELTNDSGYLTEHQDISGKVDKVEGKSLISDTEIARLASVDNYDDTDIKAEIAKKADTTSIPRKVSELTNDSNYQTAEQVNSTVTTEIAKVVADAPEDLNTLKEMSDWIAGHEDDASAMNSAISDNKTAITALQSGKADKSEIPTTLPADGGNADTVNNHTVKSDVPENAVFTDTVYDDTEVKESIAELSSNLDTLEFGEVAGGKNLIDVSKVIRGEMVEGYVTDGNNYITDFIHLEYGKNYILSNCYKEVHETAWFTQDKTFVQRTFGVEVTPPTNDCYYARIEYGVEQGINAQLEEGTQATEYEPYIPSVKMLADENVHQSNEAMDLKMLGWTVPSECPIQNYVDSNGVFHQRVDRVDLGSLEWTYDTLWKATSGVSTIKNLTVNMYHSVYVPTIANVSDIPTNSVKKADSGTLWINNGSSTEKPSGYLYFELAEEKSIKLDGNEAVTKVNDSLGVIGKCKNLLNSTLQTTTVNGITCTKNGDGTYTLNGTATAKTDFTLMVFDNLEVGKKYKLVGCPSGGSVSSYRLMLQKTSTWDNTVEDIGNGGIIKALYNKTFECWIRIEQETTVNNLIFKPMFTENLNATYDDFVPYTGDGETLTHDVAQLRNDLVPKKIELQNVDERVTIQDNGSFIINGFAFVNLLVTFNETLPQWSNFVRLPRPKGDNISVHCENSVILAIYSQDNLPGDCGTTENVASGTEIRLLVNYEVA